jgi:hypothetical protein
VLGTGRGGVIFCKPVVYQPATYNELRTTNGADRRPSGGVSVAGITFS